MIYFVYLLLHIMYPEWFTLHHMAKMNDFMSFRTSYLEFFFAFLYLLAKFDILYDNETNLHLQSFTLIKKMNSPLNMTIYSMVSMYVYTFATNLQQ